MAIMTNNAEIRMVVLKIILVLEFFSNLEMMLKLKGIIINEKNTKLFTNIEKIFYIYKYFCCFFFIFENSPKFNPKGWYNQSRYFRITLFCFNSFVFSSYSQFDNTSVGFTSG